jgi:arylsulfatase A-like enzyme
MLKRKPNVIYIFSDQHRKEATGFGGNLDVKTPILDQLAARSLSFETAVSNMPVCCPYRATLLTGQYPQTHGVFMNDVSLSDKAVSIAEAFKRGGYSTGYIGKWHVDGRGRSSYIPPERRQGFEYWRVLECTHSYNKSDYYSEENGDVLQRWEGYDAKAQADCAADYITERCSQAPDQPFLLVLSWGPPHNPYGTAPEPFRDMYNGADLQLRPNVPASHEDIARRDLAGYYAHITALDTYIGSLLETVRSLGIEEDTIFIYTSDHGDMLGSHGLQRKQWPWDESILVPYLLRYPRLFHDEERKIKMPVCSPDIMPTLLGLCGLDIPDTVEGIDHSPYLRGECGRTAESALIQCITPFGEAHRGNGGREYRGVRTERYTYVRDLNGPWLLFDNASDPYQLNNLVGREEYRDIQKQLEDELQQQLQLRSDAFLPGEDYVKLWGYVTDETGTVPYTK